MNTTSPTHKSLPVILDEIEHRANVATAGPWHVTTNHQIVGQKERQPPEHICSLKAALKSKGSEQRNGAFIAAARSDVPKLVKALRAISDYKVAYFRDGLETDLWLAGITSVADAYAKGSQDCHEALKAEVFAHLLTSPADSKQEVPDGKPDAVADNVSAV